MSSFAEATVASMPGTFERNLHVAHVPSTSTISSTPRAARPSSTLSSMRARQGTSAYFAGSARRFDAMRAHANTAFPPVAATADATLEARSSSSGRNGMSASTGHTVVQAPHATHPSPSSSNTLLAANTEPVGVRAFRARRMAVAHHHAAIARQVHGLRLQRLGHFHDVYQVRHANSSSRLPLLLEKRLLDGA